MWWWEGRDLKRSHSPASTTRGGTTLRWQMTPSRARMSSMQGGQERGTSCPRVTSSQIQIDWFINLLRIKLTIKASKWWHQWPSARIWTREESWPSPCRQCPSEPPNTPWTCPWQAGTPPQLRSSEPHLVSFSRTRPPITQSLGPTCPNRIFLPSPPSTRPEKSRQLLRLFSPRRLHRGASGKDGELTWLQ